MIDLFKKIKPWLLERWPERAEEIEGMDRAVNAHDPIVEALKKCDAYMTEMAEAGYGDYPNSPMGLFVKAALAKAKAGA